MDKDIELKLVDSFFSPRKRERARYALFSMKKRRDFIWDFSDDFFIKDCLSRIEQSIPSYETVLQILRKKNIPEDCYVLSIDESIDGKILPIEMVLKQAVGFGPILVSCVHGKLAYFECEQSIGAPDRYLLTK